MKRDTCATTGKVQFRSPEEADRRRRELKRRHNDRQHAYRCEHCRWWHLGHGHRSAGVPQTPRRKAG